MMASSGATVIAAMVAKARREVRENFEGHEAFDIPSAIAYDPPTPCIADSSRR